MTLLVRSSGQAALLLLVATGCSTPTPAPVPSPVCVAEDCNGQDPAVIKCDEGALSITWRNGKPIEIGEVEGMLEIRKSRPDICTNIYWARFTPDANSTGGYEVILDLNGKRSEPQKSEPQSPTTPAWSVVFFANKGDTLTACIIDAATRQEGCTDPLEVV